MRKNILAIENSFDTLSKMIKDILPFSSIVSLYIPSWWSNRKFHSYFDIMFSNTFGEMLPHIYLSNIKDITTFSHLCRYEHYLSAAHRKQRYTHIHRKAIIKLSKHQDFRQEQSFFAKVVQMISYYIIITYCTVQTRMLTTTSMLVVFNDHLLTTRPVLLYRELRLVVCMENQTICLRWIRNFERTFLLFFRFLELETRGISKIAMMTSFPSKAWETTLGERHGVENLVSLYFEIAQIVWTYH